MAPSQLWLVRHGQTEWSATGRHTGRTDLPLDDTGRQQARALGARLAGQEFALVLSSPLRRAHDTCDLAGYGSRAELDDDLCEWDYGAYEGRTTEEIRGTDPGWTLWRDGCPNGETLAQVGVRAERVITRARAANGDTVAFAHGHLLRVLAACWVGLPPADGGLLALDAASISLLGWEREQPVIRTWNVGARP